MSVKPGSKQRGWGRPIAMRDPRYCAHPIAYRDGSLRCCVCNAPLPETWHGAPPPDPDTALCRPSWERMK